MFYSYFDESGDAGMTAQSPTAYFTLAAVLIREEDWLATLDETVRFRRFLRDQFKIKLSDELKAANLIKSKGPFAHLSPQAALRVYGMCMRFQEKCSTLRTFAVFIDKSKLPHDNDPREKAWTYSLQRLERIGMKGDGRNPGLRGNTMLFPDNGHGMFLRKMVRAHRRHHLVPSAFGAGSLSRPAFNLLEDPHEKKSQESFFVQFADLNAYAASRRVTPTAKFDGKMWEALGASRISQVNSIRGGPDGIVVWPK